MKQHFSNCFWLKTIRLWRMLTLSTFVQKEHWQCSKPSIWFPIILGLPRAPTTDTASGTVSASFHILSNFLVSLFLWHFYWAKLSVNGTKPNSTIEETFRGQIHHSPYFTDQRPKIPRIMWFSCRSLVRGGVQARIRGSSCPVEGSFYYKTLAY